MLQPEPGCIGQLEIGRIPVTLAQCLRLSVGDEIPLPSYYCHEEVVISSQGIPWARGLLVEIDAARGVWIKGVCAH